MRAGNVLVDQRPADRRPQMRIQPDTDMADPARLTAVAIQPGCQIIGAVCRVDRNDPTFFKV